MKARQCVLVLMVVLGVNTAPGAHAQRIQSCSFNQGQRLQATITDLANGFRIEWSDGPAMTYVNLNVGGDTQKFADRLGGQWWWNSHRDGIGFNLYNPNNRNVISCYE